MNAERLHAIAKALRQDLQQSDLLSLLDQLNSSLQNQVNQPGSPQFQQQVSQIYSTISAALANSTINNYSPTWKQILEEIGYYKYIGVQLKVQIDDIFSRNGITPSVALTELQSLRNKVAELVTSLDQLLNACNQFKIGSEILNPGECEIGILLPRAFVSNKLDSFGSEIKELNKILSVFSEVSTGSRPAFEINTISTTDFSIFIHTLPPIAACIAVAVERIVTVYDKLLDIRIKHKELRKLGIEEENLKGISQHADQMIDNNIDKIAAQLLAEFYASNDHGRRNELETELKVSLKEIVIRIDRGFNLEVRMGPPQKPTAAPDGTEDAESTNKLMENYKQIKNASKTLQFLKLDGDPLLKLPGQDTPPQGPPIKPNK